MDEGPQEPIRIVADTGAATDGWTGTLSNGQTVTIASTRLEPDPVRRETVLEAADTLGLVVMPFTRVA